MPQRVTLLPRRSEGKQSAWTWRRTKVADDAAGIRRRDRWSSMHRPETAGGTFHPSTQRWASNVGWSFVGHAGYLSCQYCLLMVVAKFGSRTLVGDYSYALAICTPIIALSQLQLRQLLVTDVKEEFGFDDYFNIRKAGVLLACFAVGVVVAVQGCSWHLVAVTLLLTSSKALESLSDIAYGRLQRADRLCDISVSQITKGIANVGAFTLGLWLWHSLIAAIGLGVVANGLFFFSDYYRALRIGNRLPSISKPVRPRVLPLLRLAAPLGVTVGLQALSGSLPRYFLEHFQGASAVGLFSVAATPLSLMTIFNGAIAQASLARSAADFQQGRLREFKRLVFGTTLLSVVISMSFTAVVSVYGADLLELLFTPEYRSAAPCLVAMSLALSLSSFSAFGAMTLTAARSVPLQFANIVVVLCIQVPACAYFVPRFSELGAAYGEFARFGACAVFQVISGSYLLFKHAQKTSSINCRVEVMG